MRYGKVYFYDRMGNREPSESEKIRDALDKFEPPRFRPPSDQDFVKTYKSIGLYFALPDEKSGPEPLESPPPLADLRDEDLMVGHLIESPPAHFVPSSSFLLPEDPFPSGDTPPMPRCSDIPPMSVSLYTPPQLSEKAAELESKEFLAGLDLDGHDKRATGVRFEERGGRTLRRADSDQLLSNRVAHIGEESHHRGYVETAEGDLICERCLAEEREMERLRKESDNAEVRQKDALERAAKYETEMREREKIRNIEWERRERNLRAHVDNVNAEIIAAHRNRVASPIVENTLFRHEDYVAKAKAEESKRIAYREELDRQIEEQRLARIADAEREVQLANEANVKAAREHAEDREAARSREWNERERLKKSLLLQMELKRKLGKEGSERIWWVERPDEHGWREWRLRQGEKGRQLERNLRQKDSVGRLEDFKKRQAEADAVAKERQKARFEAIRKEVDGKGNKKLLQLHEQSGFLREAEWGKGAKARERSFVAVPNVEAQWRKAHEENDKRYRVLQEGRGGLFLHGVGAARPTVRKCIRCHRPLQRVP